MSFHVPWKDLKDAALGLHFPERNMQHFFSILDSISRGRHFIIFLVVKEVQLQCFVFMWKCFQLEEYMEAFPGFGCCLKTLPPVSPELSIV